MSGTEELLRIEAAGCRIGKAILLDEISLTLRRGELLGILGPNGAGKSTLLALVSGLRRPSAGSVRLFGNAPEALSSTARHALRARVAIVLQRSEYNPLVPLTVFDVAALGCLAGRGAGARIDSTERAHVMAALERMGIAHLARRTFRDLSGGEQQKTQLARALVQRPDLLLLDEPTTGLDLDWQERLVELIDRLNAEDGLTIMMTTHTPGHLPPRCARVALLRAGLLLHTGPPQETITPRHLQALYGCAVSVVERSGRRHCLPAEAAAEVDARC